uniref:Phosphorylase b kinase regulatory subunit n=1 Tax=Leptobrachium leishanense TaxID=445787 RepID=A0A8C5QMC9_9ANUR
MCTVEALQTLGRSFMNIVNSRGPSIEPWGTPHVTGREELPEIDTYCDRVRSPIPEFLRFSNKMSWSTVSNALAKSRKMRIDDDKGRTHELEHCAIKCLRGILYCYMRQADKVEQFKQDPSPKKCLHSVFHLDTGDQILSYKEYGHLQINAVSLFLLYLVQMIASGLQIIYNTDEVSFIQNLVFCVERAYRVPDFGIWERGSKYNNGSTELHSR